MQKKSKQEWDEYIAMMNQRDLNGASVKLSKDPLESLGDLIGIVCALVGIPALAIGLFYAFIRFVHWCWV